MTASQRCFELELKLGSLYWILKETFNRNNFLTKGIRYPRIKPRVRWESRIIILSKSRSVKVVMSLIPERSTTIIYKLVYNKFANNV